MTIRQTLLSMAVGSAALALATLNASAAIVCSSNVCWHAQERYVYPPEARIIIHPDDWQWGPSQRYLWREHPGRAYWRDDNWVEW
jgi:hypothetical protein